jgi:tetratricopeptide (TPR) repeat protein
MGFTGYHQVARLVVGAAVFSLGWLTSALAQTPTKPAPTNVASAKPSAVPATKKTTAVPAPAAPRKYFVLTLTNAPPTTPVADGRQDQAELLAAHEDLLAGRRDAAIAKLEKLLKRSPGVLKAWETLGWAYWQVGREKDAEALWQRWLELDPHLATPYNLLAQAAMAHKELNRALELYQQSLRLDSNQYETSYGLARLHRWTGDQDRAIDLLRDLLVRDPGRTDVKAELGRALLENDRFEEAAPIWDEMLKLSPTNQVFMLRQAMSLLHTGKVKESQELMAKILAQEPNNLTVYDMQADLALAGEHPEEAVPFLRKIIQLTQDPKLRAQTRTRLIRLLVKLNRKDALRYSVDEPMALVRDMVKENPNNTDAQLMLGEMLMMESKAEAAAEQFQYVLKNFNPDNQRARRGLFETYLGMRRFSEALEQYKIIEAFNPRNPYLHLYRARLEESRGNYSAVNRAVQALEQSASRGAVAVLVYHGLTTSEWQDTISVRRFREHMEALKQAGFRFLTPDEIPVYFDKWNKASDLSHDAIPEKAVCVTFDDARRDAMRLATGVAQQLKIRLAMHVPVGNVERGDPFICSWDMLRQYQQTGCWVMGSHLYSSHDMETVSGDAQKGCPLFNRLWLEKEKRLEGDAEFTARIAYEYHHSREVLEQQLGRKANFMAYPVGNIGQETAGNVTNAIAINLQAAATNYVESFIQTAYGFAVNGDDPLLYQRYEVEREVTGEELVQRIMENNPYFMGLSYRTKVAALEGRVYRAKALLAELQQAGYPEPLFKRVDNYVQSRLAGEFMAEGKVGGVRKGPFHLDLSKPYVGVRGEFFSNNLDEQDWRVLGLGGLRVTPNLVLEGRAGAGQMRQPMMATNSASPDIKLNEKVAGLYPAFTFASGWLLNGEIAMRNLSGDVPTNLNGATRSFDQTFLQYAVEGQGKIFAPLDINLRFEHDVMPSARQAALENTYNLVSANAAFDLTDWWQLQGGGQHYWFSDDNKRDHATFITDWMLWEPAGVHAGLGYAYANAADASRDYWTPYKLNRYFAEAGFRGNYLRIYYNLAVQYGVGKQSIRPETQAAYEALVQRAQRERWPQSAKDQIVAPEANWQPAFQIKASSRAKLGGSWDLNAEAAYNRVLDYNEFTLLGGIKYHF